MNNKNWSGEAYAKAAIIAQFVEQEVTRRLTYLSLVPSKILDIGCGIGGMSVQLRKQYPYATGIFALDLSMDMLHYARQPWSVCAMGEQLPFANSSIDLIVANLVLPWCSAPVRVLQECKRVLIHRGALILTVLGLDTLREWRSVLTTDEMPHLMDMNDLGNSLIQTGWIEPVVDRDHYVIHYTSKHKLSLDLWASGMLVRLQKTEVEKRLEPVDPITQHGWPVTYEIIYANAFSSVYCSGNDPRISVFSLKS